MAGCKTGWLTFALLAMPATANATATQAGPYKLVLTWGQSGLTVVDYPSAARCEQARRAVDAEKEVRQAQAQRRTAESEGLIIGSPWTVYAFCIPG